MKEARFIEGLKTLQEGSNEYSYKYNENIVYQCQIHEWRKEQLEAKYPDYSLEDVLLQFSQILSLPGELLGKRSSEIAVSASRKYCFKLIDEETLKKYDEIFEEINKFQQEKQTDYLIDIKRVYIIESEQKKFKYTDVFLLMPCLRGKVESIMNIYDLKGYTQGRRLNQDEYEDFKFGKDQNFIQCKELQIIESVEPEKRKEFVEKFIKNVQFLQKLGIIDYSLLISFQVVKPAEENISEVKRIITPNGILIKWAIIDYFQEYNKKKKAENRFKTLFRKEISSVQPQLYAKRFIGFIQKYFE